MVTNFGYLVNFYKYINRNPIEVGLSDLAEGYPYSALFYKNKTTIRSTFNIQNIFPPHAFDECEDLNELRWINQRFAPEEAQSIACGLQKAVFAYKKDRSTNRPIEPVVRHPKKKTQEELWSELLDEGERDEPRLLSFEA